MFIQNISMADIVNGRHHYVNEKTILIQIQDYGCFQFAKPKCDFLEVHQFKFDDHDDPDKKTNITEKQAEIIASVLLFAQKEELNVVVHCHAGICRSGAVAEVGIIMGFEDRANNRIPNVLVKKRLLKALKMSNSWDD